MKSKILTSADDYKVTASPCHFTVSHNIRFYSPSPSITVDLQIVHFTSRYLRKMCEIALISVDVDVFLEACAMTVCRDCISVACAGIIPDAFAH